MTGAGTEFIAGRQRARLLARALVSAICAAALVVPPARPQQRLVGARRADQPAAQAAARGMAERAAAWICTDREQDPQGSTPIDVMQAQAPRTPDDAAVVAGRGRAERLLPLARRLFPLVLGQLAVEYAVEPTLLRGAVARTTVVRQIKPDVAARDNASMRASEPETITFGTVFLAGLRSDEGMITVLAHELAHAADGRTRVLRPLVAAVRQRAAQLTGQPVTEQQGTELTCELLGVLLARAYVGLVAPRERTPPARRLARALGKNCVTQAGGGDDAHLAPRAALVVLLKLEPALAGAVVEPTAELNGPAGANQ